MKAVTVFRFLHFDTESVQSPFYADPIYADEYEITDDMTTAISSDPVAVDLKVPGSLEARMFSVSFRGTNAHISLFSNNTANKYIPYVVRIFRDDALVFTGVVPFDSIGYDFIENVITYNIYDFAIFLSGLADKTFRFSALSDPAGPFPFYTSISETALDTVTLMRFAGGSFCNAAYTVPPVDFGRDLSLAEALRSFFPQSYLPDIAIDETLGVVNMHRDWLGSAGPDGHWGLIQDYGYGATMRQDSGGQVRLYIHFWWYYGTTAPARMLYGVRQQVFNLGLTGSSLSFQLVWDGFISRDLPGITPAYDPYISQWFTESMTIDGELIPSFPAGLTSGQSIEAAGVQYTLSAPYGDPHAYGFNMHVQVRVVGTVPMRTVRLAMNDNTFPGYHNTTYSTLLKATSVLCGKSLYYDERGLLACMDTTLAEGAPGVGNTHIVSDTDAIKVVIDWNSVTDVDVASMISSTLGDFETEAVSTAMDKHYATLQFNRVNAVFVLRGGLSVAVRDVLEYRDEQYFVWSQNPLEVSGQQECHAWRIT